MQNVILTILKFMVPVMIQALRSVISNELFVKYGDKILDVCERAIQKEPDWYDPYLMELVALVRDMAKIPDLPDEPA